MHRNLNDVVRFPAEQHIERFVEVEHKFDPRPQLMEVNVILRDQLMVAAGGTERGKYEHGRNYFLMRYFVVSVHGIHRDVSTANAAVAADLIAMCACNCRSIPAKTRVSTNEIPR